jgi:hypothetical protein
VLKDVHHVFPAMLRVADQALAFWIDDPVEQFQRNLADMSCREFRLWGVAKAGKTRTRRSPSGGRRPTRLERDLDSLGTGTSS